MKFTLKATVALLFLLTLQTGFAQRLTDIATITFDSELEAGPYERMRRIGTDGTHHYYFSNKGPKHIVKYDLNFKEVARHEVRYKINDVAYVYRDIYLLGEKLVCISTRSAGSDDFEFCAFEIDKESLEPKGTVKDLATIERTQSGNAGTVRILSRTSPDGRKLLIRCEGNFKPLYESVREVLVVNDQLEVESRIKDFGITYSTWEFKIDWTMLTNSGDIIVIGKKHVAESALREYRRSGRTNFQFHVFCIKKGTTTPTDIAIPNDGHRLLNLTDVDAPDGKLQFAGLYSDSTEGIPHGAISLSVDLATSKVTTTGKKAFDFTLSADRVGKHDGPKKLKPYKAGKSRDHYTNALRVLKVGNDGEYLLLAEREMTVDGYETNYSYVEDVIATKFTADGKPEWVVRVPKCQRENFIGRPITSYQCLIENGRYFLLYNDLIDNVKAPTPDNPRILRRSERSKIAYVITELLPNGEYKTEFLYFYSSDEVSNEQYINYYSVKVLSPGDIVVGARGKKDLKIGKLKFN